jgi:predicted ATPase/class 3 adenylate cyclase
MVTFLFTDIEGSSQKWDRARTAMQAAVATHDAILDEAIDRHRGHVVKKLGDGFMAAFADPADAVVAAFDAQRMIGGTDWEDAVGLLRVRMGVHTGPGEPIDGDYLGPSLNRAARIEAAGHGGQILTSAATRELIGDRLDRILFRDLGEHHLRGLTRTERIYQVTGEGLETDFPPLLTESTPTNLPAEVKSVVGRERELADLSAALDQARLLTVTGAGGAGKTTLAMEAARRRTTAHPGGVWLFELAPLDDGRRIAVEMLGVMRRPAPADQDASDVLLEALASQRALLVIDNCEHLLADVADLVSRILKRSPNVKVLATSREPLGVGGERVWMIPTMTIPSQPTVEAVNASDAGALFVARARDSDASFELTVDTARIVAEICSRLDGLPLALELAAARLRLMSLTEVDRLLDNRFRLLRGGDRDAIAHHRTLEGTITWSYDLLEPDDRRLFRCLSVFAGGFDLEAAEALEHSDVDIVDGLDHLVSQSLVVADRGDMTRYRMLESIRQFAADRLDEAGETDAAARAHLDWILGLVKEGARRLEGRDQLVWQRRFRVEIDNIRRALSWAEQNDPISGSIVAAALSRFFWMYAAEGDSTTMTDATSFLNEGYDWATAMLDAAGDSLPEKLRARLQMGTGGLLCVRLGRFEEGLERLKEADAIFEALDDQRSLGWTKFYQGIAGFGLMPPEDVASLFERALTLHTAAEDRLGVASSTLLVGWVRTLESPAAGRPYVERFATAAEAMGAPFMLAHADDALATLDALEGSGNETSRLRAARSLVTFRKINNYACLCHALGGSAALLAQQGDHEGAARVLGIADATRDRLSMVIAPYEERESYVREIAAEAADTPEWEQAVAEGRTFEPDEGIDWTIRRLKVDLADIDD